MLIFILSAVFICGSPDYYKGVTDSSPRTIYVIIVFSWAATIGSFSLSVMFAVLSSFVKYFKYPSLIMKALGEPIEGDTIKDYVLWWQLRKYYIENEVRITGKIINLVLTSAFGGSIIVLTVLIIAFRRYTIENFPSDVYKLVIIMLLVYSFILILAQNASSYYDEQSKHQNMLVREKLRIETRNYDKYKQIKNENNNDNEKLIKIIDLMISDINHNITGIKMIGIQITPNMMLLIRGYIISGIIALVASYFT